MPAKGQDFVGLMPLKETRPKAAWFGPAGGTSFFRDQLTISSWLCIGALIQGVLFLTIGRLSLIPAAALLLYRTLDTYAQVVGFKENSYIKDVVPHPKFTAQIPDENGKFGSKPADTPVTVFLIGTRSNHPLGALAPGFKELGAYFRQMTLDLEDHAEEFGFLGMTSWLNASVRATGSELMSVAYFRSPEGLSAFAHSDYHRAGWNWWNRTVKQHPHLSIYHEMYDVPKGHWETIYANSHASGLASTTFKVTDEQTGKVSYASPIVDATRGAMRTGLGRMGRSTGEENDKYEQAQY